MPMMVARAVRVRQHRTAIRAELDLGVAMRLVMVCALVASVCEQKLVRSSVPEQARPRTRKIVKGRRSEANADYIYHFIESLGLHLKHA